jgi:hypothetical protein
MAGTSGDEKFPPRTPIKTAPLSQHFVTINIVKFTGTEECHLLVCDAMKTSNFTGTVILKTRSKEVKATALKRFHPARGITV